MIRFYLIPRAGTGTHADPYRPRYIYDAAMNLIVSGGAWMDYGEEGTFLVGLTLTQAQHDALVTNSDVVAVPALDTPVGGNPTLTRLRNELEARSIPGDWIVSTHTWRAVVGRIGRVCLILQRMNGLGRRVFGSGRALETVPSVELVTDLTAAAVSLGLTVTGLATALTIRAALLLLADQLPAFSLMGEAF